MKDGIRNLVFDVGGVLLTYRWRDMFAEYGLSREEGERIGWEMFRSPVWLLMDYGLLSIREAMEKFDRMFPEDREYIDRFLLNIQDMPVRHPEIEERILELKKDGYGIYILSNYNGDMFRIHTENAPFIGAADGILVSYMVHMIKPEPRLYRRLLEMFDLKAEETVFFDDRADNVEGAKRVGMNAELVAQGNNLLELLERY